MGWKGIKVKKLGNISIAIIIIVILIAAAFINTAVAGEYKEYVVKKGDTLWSIAKKEANSNIVFAVSKISKANNLSNPNLIIPGQILKIGDEEYLARKGDTLWGIAKKKMAGDITSTVINISRENGLFNPDFIVAGQVLKIRGEEVVKKEIPRLKIAPEIPQAIVKDQEKRTEEKYSSKYLAERINLPLVISLSTFIAVFCFFYDQVFFESREKRGKVNLGHRIISKK